MKSLSVKLGVILIGVLIFDYAEVWGADWRFYEESKMQSYYYDAESITRISKSTIRVWDKSVYTERGITGMVKTFGDKYNNLHSTKAVYEIDCFEKKHRVLHIAHYSKDNEILYSESSEGEWGYIVPESIAESLFKILCM